MVERGAYRSPTPAGETRWESRRRGELSLHAVGARLPENRVDAFDQLAGTERLRDVIVGADLEADLLIDVPSLGRQQDHRDVARLGLGLEHLAGLVAVELRHHDIEHDQVRMLGARL